MKRPERCSTVATTPRPDDCARGWALNEADRKLAASLLQLDLNRHRAKGSYIVRIETRWRTTRVATNNKSKNPYEEKIKDQPLTNATFS